MIRDRRLPVMALQFSLRVRPVAVSILYVVASFRPYPHDIQRGKDVGRLKLEGGPGRPGTGSDWIKSSLSFSNSNCVEVTNLPHGEVGVRDSKDSEGPVLRFTPGEWHAFLGGVRSGEFDSFGRV